MELFSLELLGNLLAIIIIDLVLAGDNAVVIAMAAKNLPAVHQKKAIVFGTAGAIIVRIIATAFVCQLLKIPALMFAGGLLLILIAYKLLTDKNEEERSFNAATSLGGAIRTIIIADSVMGIDNVMGIAGTAQGHLPLVIAGLLISIPLVVWGSRMLLDLLNRYPQIIYLGGGVLAWSAGAMIIAEPLVADYIVVLPFANWLVPAVVTISLIAYCWLENNYISE